MRASKRVWALGWMLTGCAPLVGGEAEGDEPGTAVANITVVPEGTQCVALAMTRGATTVWRGFEVIASRQARLHLGRLEPGAVTVRGWALANDCDTYGVDDGPDVMALNREAAWLSEAVDVTVTATGHTSVALTMRRNGTAGAVLDFLPAEGVAEVFSGPQSNSTFARMADGTIWAWGRNDNSQLGDNSTTDRFMPTPTMFPSDCAGISGDHSGALCVAPDSVVWRAGNTFGGPAYPPRRMDSEARARVVLANSVSGPSGLQSFGTAIIQTYGLNVVEPEVLSPLAGPPLSADERPTTLAGSGASLCVLTTRGRLFCNFQPTGCGGASGNPAFGTTFLNNGLTAVARGESHLCAARVDGSVGCCGANANFQLGNGSFGGATGVTTVAGLANVRALGAGRRHTCALVASGDVYCWGGNDVGQLGRGSVADSFSAQRVPGITNATSLAVGADHTCARTSDGRVWCWGGNTYGQLGDGTITPRYAPVQVAR